MYQKLMHNKSLRLIGGLLGGLRFLDGADKLGPVILGILRDGPEHIGNQGQNSFGLDTVLCAAKRPAWNFAVLAASLFAVFLFTVFGGYSLLLWCQQSLWMVVPPALVLAVLVWTFLKMDDKITALQKRVDELEAAQKSTEKLEK